jgi:NADH-quinone oxidoreductase subunit N
MISANDLIALYVGLELQSLSLYVIAAMKRDQLRSTEAGLKYFVLGALSSGLLLYGCSLIYGFAGTTSFESLADQLGVVEEAPIGLIVGLVFLSAGLAFKVSAVPFHMWTPDVYEGAPTPVTAFFAVAPKIAAMALLLRVMLGPFGDLVEEWRQIVWAISVGSMVLGALAAIAQTNIKRLMAYSSIGHVGYALMGLAAGTEQGAGAVMLYLAIYLVMNVGTFACILSMKVNDRMVENISDLAGLSKARPGMAFAMMLFMFSLAGIPPLAGFFGKFFVFAAAIDQGLIYLAIIGALASVISAFYYLRIIKVMYFDEGEEVIDPVEPPIIRAVLAVSSVAVLAFALAPQTVADYTAFVAAALFS